MNNEQINREVERVAEQLSQHKFGSPLEHIAIYSPQDAGRCRRVAKQILFGHNLALIIEGEFTVEQLKEAKHYWVIPLEVKHNGK